VVNDVEEIPPKHDETLLLDVILFSGCRDKAHVLLQIGALWS